jgi:hypothetical protein
MTTGARVKCSFLYFFYLCYIETPHIHSRMPWMTRALVNGIRYVKDFKPVSSFATMKLCPCPNNRQRNETSKVNDYSS